jgi:hypothetical protein
MSLKVHPKYGIYDLSFRTAVKSLIKDGFISRELIDGLYAKDAQHFTEYKGMPLEEATIAVHKKFSPLIMLCSEGETACVKLKPYGTDANGDALYIYDGHTRPCTNYCRRPTCGWSGRYGTLEQIRSVVQKQNPNKTFVTVCHRTSEGVLEPVGYVI